ncbi:hypothetical protein C0J52_26332, partial [Blattella germanica]
EPEQNGRSRPSPTTKPPIVSIGTDEADADGEAWRRRQGRSRRMSRVTRQHSYDDELKNASGVAGPGGGGEPALELSKGFEISFYHLKVGAVNEKDEERDSTRYKDDLPR